MNKKFDIFYYLKWIKQFKNLKKFVFEKNDKAIFKLLSKNVYDLFITDYNYYELFKTSKSIGDILDQFNLNLKSKSDSDFAHFVYENLKE